MQASAQALPVSKVGVWSGRIVSALVIVFMLFDGGIKVLKLAPAVEGTTRLGYPAGPRASDRHRRARLHPLVCHPKDHDPGSDPAHRLYGGSDCNPGAP